jgi:hypothetical protein
MPLSEQEQRLLEEMERSLYHNDADFVSGSSGRHGKPTYTSVITGVLVGVVGIAALIAGVVIRQPIVGVLGFVLMFTGVLVALTSPRDRHSGSDASTGSGSDGSNAASARRPSFLQNLTERWEKRQNDHDE